LESGRIVVMVFGCSWPDAVMEALRFARVTLTIVGAAGSFAAAFAALDAILSRTTRNPTPATTTIAAMMIPVLVPLFMVDSSA